jgi:Anti-sigma-K factor rskA, C-terminal
VSATDDDRIAYLAGDAVESLSARERAELDELRDALREPATWIEPSPGLEDRIVAAIAEEARARPADAADAAVAADAPAAAGAPPAAPESTQPSPAARPSKPTEPRRRRFNLGEIFRRPAYAFGGLAAAAAVALVAIVIVTSGKTSPKPLHFAMVVSGTQLAPRAKGTASLTKTVSGWKIQLTATGLPHIQNGRYYQAWLKNDAGILVPVGTFNDAQKVTLWSGVPVTKFRTLTVTLQLANGNPVSSGKRVLIGRIVPRG